MLNSPYSKESVRLGILHYLLGRGLAGLAGFATVILLVRYMDVQSYAGFTALTGLIAMSGVFAGLGLERAVSRYVPEARLERSASELGSFIWRISLVRLSAALFVCLLFYVFWRQILHIFPDVLLTEFPISILYFVVAETLFQHFSSVLQALIKQKALTRILIVQWGGRLVMIAWVMSNHASISLEESLLIMAVPEMMGVLFFVILLLHDLNELKVNELRGEGKPLSHVISSGSWPNWKEISKMAGHNYGFTLLAAPPQGYFMKMLAAVFLPTQMVAAYGFFISIAERARQYIPLHLLYNLIEPVMIGNYLQNRDFTTLNKRCQLLYKSNLVLLIPLLAWVAAAGTFIIATLTGGKYQEYLWLLMVVMLQLTVGSHVVLLQLILNSVGSSVLLIRAGIVALLGMALFLVITMFINVQFLVIAPLVFSLICNTHIIHAIKHQGYPYKLSWKLFFGASISGVIAFLITWPAISQHFVPTNITLITSIVSGLAIFLFYLLGLYFFKAVHTDEIELIKSLLHKKNSTADVHPNVSATIDQLQNEARKVLDEIIAKDAHIILLDYPNNTNVGDSLIWLGEIAYLESRGLKPAYVCDVKNYNEANIRKLINNKSLILMHGGGNFGTMWTEIHNFRLQVLRDFPNVPIVQLPQTIHFNDEVKTKEMADAIKTQGNYTLLARSQPSYDFARGNFIAKIRLCPDMAFFIGSIQTQNKFIFDRFILARTDHEKSGDLFIETIKAIESKNSYEISDWLAASWQERMLHRLEIHTGRLRNKFDPNNLILFHLWNALSRLRLKRGVSLLTRGRIVLTDRLHAHVLSILLNKPHVLVDNNYGKIGNFYKTWTHSHITARFVMDLSNLHLVVDELDTSLNASPPVGVSAV